ncbi:MAG: hypothetical protein HWN68_18225 [Desulfobacterales bacterium]|nr:hypothetical protein [Desulfobacterales bacterium]
MTIIPRWAPLDIQQTWDANTATIVLTTNVPCHLWLYYTTKQPWVHRQTRIVRGLTVPWDAYWCFVIWQKNEQLEPDDTLTHTFIKPDWKYCETRWFCFRGTVEGQLSPSDSPIFSKHYDGKYLKAFIEPWTWLGVEPPEFTLHFTEPWTWLGVDPPEFTLHFNELWSS